MGSCLGVCGMPREDSLIMCSTAPWAARGSLTTMPIISRWNGSSIALLRCYPCDRELLSDAESLAQGALAARGWRTQRVHAVTDGDARIAGTHITTRREP